MLRQLQRILGGWAAVCDAEGAVREVWPVGAVPKGWRKRLAQAVPALLLEDRGEQQLHDTQQQVTLRRLGAADAPLGALVVAPGHEPERPLLPELLPLAATALEQLGAAERSGEQQRALVLELLLAAGPAAARLGTEVRLPRPPLLVALAPLPPEGLRGRLARLSKLARSHPGGLFFAERDGHLVLIAGDGPRQRQLLAKAAATVGDRAGVSAPVSWPDLAAALRDAQYALVRAQDGLLGIDEVADAGLLAHLRASGGEPLARQLLRPLLDDREESATLLRTLRSWFEHNCAWDPTARALGIHRHTLRSRVEAAADRLGTDLDRFDRRAELWTALELLRLG